MDGKVGSGDQEPGSFRDQHEQKHIMLSLVSPSLLPIFIGYLLCVRYCSKHILTQSFK